MNEALKALHDELAEIELFNRLELLEDEFIIKDATPEQGVILFNIVVGTPITFVTDRDEDGKLAFRVSYSDIFDEILGAVNGKN
jgi:hypothetical protein